MSDRLTSEVGVTMPDGMVVFFAVTDEQAREFEEFKNEIDELEGSWVEQLEYIKDIAPNGFCSRVEKPGTLPRCSIGDFV